MTETANPYTTDGIRAGLSTYPHPKPVINAGVLIEACRVQARTWATRACGARIPDHLSGATALAALIAEIADAAECHPDRAEDDAAMYGIAHLTSAHADALRASHGHGDGYLLGALFSLISAGAALERGFEGASLMEPFTGRMPVLDESALIETARVQLNTWTPQVLQAPEYAPERIKDAPALSDVIAEVLDAAEARYGDMDDDNSIQGMAHLANARAHGLKAAYGHGNAYLLALLHPLICASASLA